MPVVETGLGREVLGSQWIDSHLCRGLAMTVITLSSWSHSEVKLRGATKNENDRTIRWASDQELTYVH